MSDPIANGSLSVVVGDPEHFINLLVVKDPDGSSSLVVEMNLAVRANGRVIDRLKGSSNLTEAAMAGTVSPDDVAALRRVLVALGQKLAIDAGMTVV